MATIDDVRRIAMSLPRTTEHLIGDHTKFRVGRLVYASVSPDEERLGFGFPKDMGMRIDLVYASAAVAGRVDGAYVDREARKGRAPSDHAPVVVDLS